MSATRFAEMLQEKMDSRSGFASKPVQLRDILDAFRHFDPARGGHANLAMFESTIARLNIDVPRDVLRDVFAQIADPATGTIEYRSVRPSDVPSLGDRSSPLAPLAWLLARSSPSRVIDRAGATTPNDDMTVVSRRACSTTLTTKSCRTYAASVLDADGSRMDSELSKLPDGCATRTLPNGAARPRASSVCAASRMRATRACGVVCVCTCSASMDAPHTTCVSDSTRSRAMPDLCLPPFDHAPPCQTPRNTNRRTKRARASKISSSTSRCRRSCRLTTRRTCVSSAALPREILSTARDAMDEPFELQSDNEVRFGDNEVRFGKASQPASAYY